MKEFKGSGRGGKGGGFHKKSFGGNRGGGRGGSRPWEKRGGDGVQKMYSATCAECGKETEVPFRPTGERPVYCRDCFGGKREVVPQRASYKKDFSDKRGGGSLPISSDKRIDEIKWQLESAHKKIDGLIETVGKLSATLLGEIKREALRDAMVKAEILPATKKKAATKKSSTKSKKED